MEEGRRTGAQVPVVTDASADEALAISREARWQAAQILWDAYRAVAGPLTGIAAPEPGFTAALEFEARIPEGSTAWVGRTVDGYGGAKELRGPMIIRFTFERLVVDSGSSSTSSSTLEAPATQ